MSSLIGTKLGNRREGTEETLSSGFKELPKLSVGLFDARSEEGSMDGPSKELGCDGCEVSRADGEVGSDAILGSTLCK